MARGWSPERKAFVQTFGSDTLDASNLIMPLVFFLSPKDPRILSTLEAIDRSPRDGGLVSNSLVYRYDVEKSADGLTGEEGTFSLCTFWLVEALTCAGRIDEARLIFEQMLSYANHLGLYAEEIGPSSEAHFLHVLQAKKRADERTRTADLLQLRVRFGEFAEVHRRPQTRISKPFSR
jgi:pentatricopeptide repeat protein